MSSPCFRWIDPGRVPLYVLLIAQAQGGVGAIPFLSLAPFLPVADVFFAFRESALPGKIIVLVLFAGSIVAWSVMVTKFIELQRATRQSRSFVRMYRDEEHPVALFLKRRRFPESPHYRVYEAGCLAIGGEFDAWTDQDSDLFASNVTSVANRLDRLQLEATRNLLERNVAGQALRLERSMGVLATSVSSAPFLGLLGTVWGVMDAFGGMAATGAATLSAVAPGISGALLTTVVGLLVALPSAVGYNLLTSQVRTLTVEMDNFAQEFESDIRRTYAKD